MGVLDIQKKSKKAWFLVLFACSCVVSVFFSGCATVPSGKGAGFPVQKMYVDNRLYYPLQETCAYFKIDWEYDAIARQIHLRKADTEVKLLVGSPVILVNGSPLDISDPVRIHNGVAAIPFKFKEMVIDRFYCQVAPPGTDAYSLSAKLKKIVLDAGHGGHDPGAIGRTGLREKDVNLDIAKRLSHLLMNRGIDVVMTRTADRFITLEQRAEIANRAHADFFVSLHSNSARSPKLNGFEVYYISENVNDAARALNAAKTADLHFEPASFYNASLNLKATLWDMLYSQNRAESVVLAQNICQAAGRNLELKILGVKSARFYVLKGTRVPAVLIEVGFLSHPSEERYLRNGFYRQQIAEAICEGIVNYGRQYDLASNSFR